MPPIELPGCAPIPLADYLKALGILRLVAEQADPGVRGYWHQDRFILETKLDKTAMADFFLQKYSPTPIIAPWNGGSGFYPKDNRTGFDPLRSSAAPRFADYAETIELGQLVIDSLGFEERPKDTGKSLLLQLIRSRLPDHSLDWFDSAVLMSRADVRYPPLLGTGGNDGRLDFTNNFMQRIVEIFDTESGQPRSRAAAWLEASLFGEPSAGQEKAAIGQFSPGAAGGPNATSGFDAGSLVNPWDFVFILEGSLLFTAAATRRLETGGEGALSYPFTVRPSAIGSGAADPVDENDARAEIWVPLWRRPAGLSEVRALFAEGRATLGRRPAADGLDFARAVARLGVARGIDAFQRYALLMRSGKAYLATPLNRFFVHRNRQADLIDDLDRRRWLAVVRRLGRQQDAPARIRGAVRSLENSIVELTQMTGQAGESRTPQVLQQILIAVGAVMTYFAHAPRAREQGTLQVRPLQLLSAEWLWRADDRSDEFRIAAALAALGSIDTPMRMHLAPVGPPKTSAPGTGTASAREDVWLETAPAFVWGSGSLEDNLIAVLQRRLILANQTLRLREDGDADASVPERHDRVFAAACGTDLPAIAAFLEGRTDDPRIEALLAGLAWVRPPRFLPFRPQGPAPLPAAFSLLKPIFTPRSQLRHLGILPEGTDLPVPPQLIRLLAAGRVDEAMRLGVQRVHASGLPAGFDHLSAPTQSGPRLAAALLIPLAFTESPRHKPEEGKAPDPADTHLAAALGRVFDLKTNLELEPVP